VRLLHRGRRRRGGRLPRRLHRQRGRQRARAGRRRRPRRPRLHPPRLLRGQPGQAAAPRRGRRQRLRGGRRRDGPGRLLHPALPPHLHLRPCRPHHRPRRPGLRHVLPRQRCRPRPGGGVRPAIGRGLRRRARALRRRHDGQRVRWRLAGGRDHRGPPPPRGRLRLGVRSVREGGKGRERERERSIPRPFPLSPPPPLSLSQPMDLAQQHPLAEMDPEHPRDTPAVDLTANVFRSPKERAIAAALGACAMLSVVTTLGIAGVLVYESLAFFAEVSPLQFLTETEWTPQFVDPQYGVLPLVSGTLLITVIAAAVALPLGLMSAIYIAEYAPARVRKVLKPGLELLAGVPTVVYGYFALTFVTPLLQQLIPALSIYNALSAGLVVGVMILPMVASLSEDALRAVPRTLADGAYALGATKVEVVLRVLVPGALSGIVA